MASSCSVPDCDKPHEAKGYCGPHYYRLCKHGDPLGGRTAPGELRRFIHEVAMNHTGNECLTWPFWRSRKGYGRVTVDGKQMVVSRYVCELAHGAPTTPEHEAAHSCGKGCEGCIAPGHLEWKTPAENNADKLIHGTHNRGDRNGRAKLTETAVREIISLKGMEPQCKLAERFMVSPTTISQIYSGRVWSSISEQSKEKAA